jgi:hypothetical protein
MCAFLYPDLRNLRAIGAFALGKLGPAHPGPGPGENEPMAGSSAPPALSKGEQQAAEALLTQAFGEPTVVRAAEQATAAAMHDRLTERWAGLEIPDYPFPRQPGAALAQLPRGWQPQP